LEEAALRTTPAALALLETLKPQVLRRELAAALTALADA